jgi:hypothetical protein
MRPKIVAVNQVVSGRVLAAWVDAKKGCAVIGGKIRLLTEARSIIDEEGELSTDRGGGRFRLATSVGWDDLLERMRERGFRIEYVRAFRRLVH